MLSLVQTVKAAFIAPVHRIYLALLIALTLFWIGAAHTAVSVNECNGHVYRALAYAELAYSDMSALHSDRGCKPHSFPFIEDRIEYPVLLAFTMWAPSHIASTGTGYFLLSAMILATAIVAMGIALFRIRGASPWIMMASPALYVYGTLNWDLVAIAFLAIGLALAPPPDAILAKPSRVMPKVAYYAMGAFALGTWTKLFPIVAVWVLLVVAFRRYGWKPALWLGIVFASITVVLNGPFALSAFDNWSYFFKLNSIRDMDPSLYTLAGLDQKRDVTIANKLSFAWLATGALFIAVTELRGKRGKIAASSAFLLVLWLIGNKIFSPQYWIWVLFAYAVAGGRTWLGLTAGAVATFEHLVVFSIMSQKPYGFMLDWQPWLKDQYWNCVHLRYVVFLVLIADIGIKLFRSDPGTKTESITPAPTPHAEPA